MISRMVFVFSLCALCLCGERGFAQEVQWRRDYNEARKEAQAKGRPLLLNFGTASCLWCDKLDATTFRDPGVVEALNERFIPLKIDADRHAALAEALRIQGYPTLVLASPDGKILDTLAGYLEAPRLHETLQRVLVQTGPVKENEAAGEKKKGGEEAEAAVRSPEAARTVARAKEEPPPDGRSRRARDLLARAREDFGAQQYLWALDRCEVLAGSYADLPEGEKAMLLATQIKSNPQWLKQACDNLTDRLGGLYLSLAESHLKQGQPQQAAIYLERVVQTLPGSRQAAAAEARLQQIRGR